MQTPLYPIVGLLLVMASIGGSAPLKNKDNGPELLSVFPWVARQGARVQAEIRGKALDGAHSVWFEDEGLSGHVLRVEQIKSEPAGEMQPGEEKREKPGPVYRVSIEVEIAARASPGSHALRLLTPAGLSNLLPFRVVDEPVLLEIAQPHQSAKAAQSVSLPVLIHGRLDQNGQLDFYSFDAKEGQQISVQVQASEKVDAHIARYREGGSWFDPDRPTRVLFEEERSSDAMPVQPKGTFRAPQNGRYFLEVSTIYGKGSPDSSYWMRLALKGSSPRHDTLMATGWKERTFERRLDPDRIRTLTARSVPSAEPAMAPSTTAGPGQKPESVSPPLSENLPLAPPTLLLSIAEREPNDVLAQALEISIPSIVEGAIRQPGDIDSFKFKVKAGQKLAFEVETPGVKPPLFNPRLGILDSQDRELFSNVHRRISLFNNNSDRQVYLKGIEPKAIYTFEKEGEYALQVRDITSRYGGPDYRYRICIRPQVPHVGEVTVSQAERINLIRGHSRKLTILTSHEEGFTGDVTFWFTGLPEGVEAFPTAEVNDKRDPTDVDENTEAVAAKIQTITVVLMADAKAPLTTSPKTVQLNCRPIAGGQPGPTLPVSRIPLMIIDAPSAK